jgi:Holliday junction resolvasome RuvABC ATP-dependent DNA helicase subunit
MHYTAPVDPVAAKLAVSRIYWDGSVRPLIQILKPSEQFAKRVDRTSIREQDVMSVFRAKQMDEYGLRPHDRAVVRTLMKASKPVKVKKGEAPRIVHQMAEGTLCAWARIDVLSYREEIKPRLRDRGFLLSMSTGQTLIDVGVAYAAAHQLTQGQNQGLSCLAPIHRDGWSR